MATAIPAETAAGGTSIPVVFVYGARETLWAGLAPTLLAEGGIVRSTLERCEKYIAARLGWSFEEVFTGDGPPPEGCMEATLVAVQLTMTAAWNERGVFPGALVGRCGGEFTAVHVAGAINFEDALELGCRVSDLIHNGRGPGRLIAVRCSQEQLETLLDDCPKPFFITGDNTDSITIIACSLDDATPIQQYLAARGVQSTLTTFRVAPHTPAVEEWRDEMLKPLQRNTPTIPRMPYYSASAAHALEAISADHHWRVVRHPAMIGRTLHAALADGYAAFVEVGARSSLREMLLQKAATLGRDVAILPTLRQGESLSSVMDETQEALLRLKNLTAACS